MNPSASGTRPRATPDEIGVWVAAAQQGDLAARAALIDQFHPLFVARSRFAPSFEDAYQDAVVAFLELLRAYDPQVGVGFVWYVNHLLRWRMFNARRSAPPDPEPLSPLIAAAEIDIDTRLAIRDALATLPARQQRVLRYWLDHDLNMAEVAAAMGVTLRAANRLRQRALDRLRPLVAAIVADAGD